MATYAARCVENEILMYFRGERKRGNDVSLSDYIETGTDGASLSLMDVVAEDEDLLEKISNREDVRNVCRAVNAVLTEQEKLVVVLRYGLEGGAPMRQREVADKILASPGEEGWGPLSILCQFLCEPRLAVSVPAEMFTPPPKVDSAFVVMPLREQPAAEVRDREMFFRIVNAAFAMRRKTMLNNLCATFRVERAEALAWMNEAGLDEKIRGEKLTIEEIARLADAVSEKAEMRNCPDL